MAESKPIEGLLIDTWQAIEIIGDVREHFHKEHRSDLAFALTEIEAALIAIISELTACKRKSHGCDTDFSRAQRVGGALQRTVSSKVYGRPTHGGNDRR